MGGLEESSWNRVAGWKPCRKCAFLVHSEQAVVHPCHYFVPDSTVRDLEPISHMRRLIFIGFVNKPVTTYELH
jgi:hypothetical protein